MKIAVVGSGISGLSCAWLLSKQHDVTLLESGNRLGGHTNTVDCMDNGKPVAIDTGFIVYNVASYPNLTAMFDHLGVATHRSDMGFGVSLDGGRYEYAGGNLGQMIGGLANLGDAGHWRMLRDIIRFFRTAESSAANLPEDSTLGDFLRLQGYSTDFTARHILPMAAAVWSAASHDMLDYPAGAFLRFFANHGLLQFVNRPQWRSVLGGSREYVKRLVASGAMTVRLASPVLNVERSHAGVVISCPGGLSERFDHVVMAVHADQALAMLDQPTPDEQRLLSAFRYSRNVVFLHRDSSLMPRRRRLWSSWNYIGGPQGSDTVTYWMNKLQELPTRTDYFVSLNPGSQPRADLVEGQFSYDHPIFDGTALGAQRQLWQLQGARNTWYCGAHFGSGFHEDGLQAGLAVAEELGGVRRPWTVANQSSRITVLPRQMPPPDTYLEAAE